jgi:Cu(I)/Ag(I) efflux system membrane fusion protein
MFAQVDIAVGLKAKVITIPLSSVIDSGTRQIVLIQQGEGRFVPREVKLGSRSDTYVEVRDGVKEGELVVVAANFLIDAESNLKAAIGGFGDTSPPKVSGHQAQGTVEDMDIKAGTLSLNHGPVASLKWPAMTMEFKVANASLLKDLKTGAKIDVEFVERQPGEWVITQVKPLNTNAPSGH